MRIKVLYEVTVQGVHYTPGVVEVSQGVGLRLLEEHRGNFEEEKQEPPRAQRARREREEVREEPVAAVIVELPELPEEEEPKEEE